MPPPRMSWPVWAEDPSRSHSESPLATDPARPAGLPAPSALLSAAPAASAIWTSLPPPAILALSLPSAHRVEGLTCANATHPHPQARHAPPPRPMVNRLEYKPCSQLLSGYEPDPVPPFTVCVNARTPTRRGQGRDSLASRRKRHGKRRTQRSTGAHAQATATRPTGIVNPEAEWHGEPDEPSPCPSPR